MNRLIRTKELLEITGLSRSTIWRMIAAGQFPASFNIGVRAVAWNSRDIDAWIASRQEAA